jgi:CheY-like chemotaxis protein
MLNILLADDNAVARQSIRFAFEQDEEWSVVEATDGQQAIGKAAELKLDLAVLDFAMPGATGIEAAAQIRLIRPQLPLILFTAYIDDFLEKQACESGFSLVVSKFESANRLADKARLLMKYRTVVTAGKPDGKRVLGGVNRQGELVLLESSLVGANHLRIKLDAPTTIYSDRHGFVPGQLSEISEHGFAATLPIELSIGDVVNVELCLPAGRRNVVAVLRDKVEFHHGFEILRTKFAEKAKRLTDESKM